MKMFKFIQLAGVLACAASAACSGNSTNEAIDSDLDGLTDTVEAELRTDAFDVDTDDDGVYDGREHFFGSDPRHGDSDRDGVRDGDEDADGNGVCERKEGQFGPFERGRRGDHGDGGVPHHAVDGGPRGGWNQGGDWGGRGDAGTLGGDGPGFSGDRPEFSGDLPDFGADGGGPPRGSIDREQQP